MRYNKDLGDFGENAALKLLQDKGFRILETKYLAKGGEVDIICMDKDIIVFVEVKTRSSYKYGRPSEAVDFRKIQHLKRAAADYFYKNRVNAEVRFDVIEVSAVNVSGEYELAEINHIQGIDVY